MDTAQLAHAADECIAMRLSDVLLPSDFGEDLLGVLHVCSFTKKFF